jgi:hypothetical protein
VPDPASRSSRRKSLETEEIVLAAAAKAASRRHNA